MPISKKIRFDVFKRDGFQCQYCGKSPPGVILEVDHIYPRKKGGKDSDDNLITSCFDCNRGKAAGDLTVSPDSLAKKLELLKDKKNQLDEYYKHQRSIQRKLNKDVKGITERWEELHNNKKTFNDKGVISVKNLLRTFNKFQIIEAFEISFAHPNVSLSSKFSYACGVLWTKKRNREEDANE